jgi:hypothetical protein
VVPGPARADHDDPFAEARSWDRVAETLVGDYRAALAERGPGHPRRMPLRAYGFVALDQKPFTHAKFNAKRRIHASREGAA